MYSDHIHDMIPPTVLFSLVLYHTCMGQPLSKLPHRKPQIQHLGVFFVWHVMNTLTLELVACCKYTNLHMLFYVIFILTRCHVFSFLWI